MDVAERAAASERIQKSVAALPAFAAASSIVLYAPVRNEVETGLLLVEARKRNIATLFPAVSGENLEFRVVERQGDLAPGRFGILEPVTNCRRMLPEEIDLVVVPAVAYSMRGERIGFGKGYYDRTVHRLEGSGRLVGVCYDFQLVPEIPHEPHDVRVDLIVTETRVVTPRIYHT